MASLEFYFHSIFTVQINIHRQCTNMAIEQVQKKVRWACQKIYKRRAEFECDGWAGTIGVL